MQDFEKLKLLLTKIHNSCLNKITVKNHVVKKNMPVLVNRHIRIKKKKIEIIIKIPI